MSDNENWFITALRADVVRRSAGVALLVGTALVVINQGDRLLRGDVDLAVIVKVILTYCVPYCVSTYAAVQAIRAAR